MVGVRGLSILADALEAELGLRRESLTDGAARAEMNFGLFRIYPKGRGVMGVIP
jgi:hypothetical protein